MAKKSRVIQFFSILVLFLILLWGSAGTSAKNNDGISVYQPLVLKNYESWSTNFANVTDLAAATISAYGASAAIDTTNVNSGGKSIKVYGTVGKVGSCLNLNFGAWGLIGHDSFDLSKKTISYEIYLPADSLLDDLSFFIFNNNQYVVIRHLDVDLQKGG